MSRWTLLGRLLSLLIGTAYFAFFLAQILAHAHSAAEVVVRSCEGCIFFIPVALIWFPEYIGAATGYLGHGQINAETPPLFVSLMGWFLLLGLPPLMYFLGTRFT